MNDAEIVLRNEDQRTAPDSGGAAGGCVTLVWPASATEYERARAEVETSPRPNVETKPAKRPALVARLVERIRRQSPVETNPADRAEEKEGASTAETPRGGCYVVTSDSQRRAWGLPDLANDAPPHDTAQEDVDTVERDDAVPVVDPTEASTCSSKTPGTSPTTATAAAAPSRRPGPAGRTRPRW